jgi:hypothetical protein
VVYSPRLGALAVSGNKGLEQLVGLGGNKARGGRMWTCEEYGKIAMGMNGSECCVKVLPFMSAVSPSCKESRVEILWNSSYSAPREGRKTTCTFCDSEPPASGGFPQTCWPGEREIRPDERLIVIVKTEHALEVSSVKTTDETFRLFFSTLGECVWIQWDGCNGALRERGSSILV